MFCLLLNNTLFWSVWLRLHSINKVVIATAPFDAYFDNKSVCASMFFFILIYPGRIGSLLLKSGDSAMCPFFCGLWKITPKTRTENFSFAQDGKLKQCEAERLVLTVEEVEPYAPPTLPQCLVKFQPYRAIRVIRSKAKTERCSDFRRFKVQKCDYSILFGRKRHNYTSINFKSP